MTARPHWIAWLAAVAAIALTVSLGNWQLRRADEKRELQARRDLADAAAPVPVATTRDLLAVGPRLPRRVTVRGEFLEGADVFLDNRIIDGRAGFQIVAPLRLAGDRSIVLVDRGWAARDPADRNRLPVVVRLEGVVAFDGLAVERLPQLYELGTAAAPTVPGIWQNFDREQYSKVTGLAVAPVLVQQTSELPDGLLRTRPRIGAGVDKHLGYAFQWYSLAALIAVLALVLGLRARRRSTQEATDGQ